MGSSFGCLRSAGLNLGWQQHIRVGLKVRGLDETRAGFWNKETADEEGPVKESEEY